MTPDVFSRLKRSIENAEAVAVLNYASSNPLQQRMLRIKYRDIINKAFPLPSDDDRREYAEEERERHAPLSNHEMTLDQKLDDPRRGQGGKD